MKAVSIFFICLGLIQGMPLLSHAEEMSITLPDGTKKPIETRKIYSSPNPTDSLLDAIAVKDLNMVKTFSCWLTEPTSI